MNRFSGWLRLHSLRVVEAVWLVVVVLFGLYQILGALVALPLLPPEFFFPMLALLLLALYVSAKWADWMDRPRLVLSNLLELDSIDHWRFTCWNRGRSCEVRAQVVGATDDRGNVLIDPQHLPIELPWTHLTGRPRIGRNDRLGQTASIVAYQYQAGIGTRRFRTLPRLALFIYGENWKPFLGQVSRFRYKTVSIKLSVDSPTDYPNIEAVEHTYRLTFDRGAKTRFRATP